MDIQKAVVALVEPRDLTREEMAGVMRQVMSGDATDAQIGALLVALRIKGETIDEIAGAAQVMRELATPVTVDCPHLVDLVGTGGDGANLFNVSTASTFVVAAAGAHVAKHGNRGVSSSSGSSDVLETLGLPLDLDPKQVARAIEEVGVGFMFAPAHHSAMRYAVGPRRELGMRTIFNVLGPLTNPAGVKRQVIGVFSAELCEPLAQVCKTLGAEHVMVLHSDDGLDDGLNDGLNDGIDTDDDNDGFSDEQEQGAGTDPLDPNSIPGDQDNDGLTDVEEVIMKLQQNLLQGDLTLPEGLKRESFVDD